MEKGILRTKRRGAPATKSNPLKRKINKKEKEEDDIDGVEDENVNLGKQEEEEHEAKMILPSIKGVDGNKDGGIDQIDHIFKLKEFLDDLLDNVVIRGVKALKRVSMRKIKDQVVQKLGTFERQESWVLDTLGTNLLEVLSFDFIDKRRTFSNNIKEIYDVLGIEAAREAIFNELSEVIEFEGTYINYHHLSLLVDRMCYSYKMIPISRHGINIDDIGPNAKASFEETPEMFLKAAKHGELDPMRGVSANIMCGQEGSFGTNAFQIFYDAEQDSKRIPYETENKDVKEEAEETKVEEENEGNYSEFEEDKALWAKMEMGDSSSMW
jgi:DNA-directed RNA polymerase beta' subunit